MSYRFTSPVSMEAYPNSGPLFGRYRLPRGITLMVTGTTVTEAQYATEEQLAACDWYLRGGYEQVISDAHATILIDAGYSECVEVVT